MGDNVTVCMCICSSLKVRVHEPMDGFELNLENINRININCRTSFSLTDIKPNFVLVVDDSHSQQYKHIAQDL